MDYLSMDDSTIVKQVYHELKACMDKHLTLG